MCCFLLCFSPQCSSTSLRIADNDGDVHQRVDHQGGGEHEAHFIPHDQLIRCLGLAGDVLQLVGHKGGGAH